MVRDSRPHRTTVDTPSVARRSCALARTPRSSRVNRCICPSGLSPPPLEHRASGHRNHRTVRIDEVPTPPALAVLDLCNVSPAKQIRAEPSTPADLLAGARHVTPSRVRPATRSCESSAGGHRTLYELSSHEMSVADASSAVPSPARLHPAARQGKHELPSGGRFAIPHRPPISREPPRHPSVRDGTRTFHVKPLRSKAPEPIRVRTAHGPMCPTRITQPVEASHTPEPIAFRPSRTLRFGRKPKVSRETVAIQGFGTNRVPTDHEPMCPTRITQPVKASHNDVEIDSSAGPAIRRCERKPAIHRDACRAGTVGYPS